MRAWGWGEGGWVDGGGGRGPQVRPNLLLPEQLCPSAPHCSAWPPDSTHIHSRLRPLARPHSGSPLKSL